MPGAHVKKPADIAGFFMSEIRLFRAPCETKRPTLALAFLFGWVTYTGVGEQS
jgi:hypothetical protein